MVVIDWVVVIVMTRYVVSSPLQAKQIFLMYKRYIKKKHLQKYNKNYLY